MIMIEVISVLFGMSFPIRRANWRGYSPLRSGRKAESVGRGDQNPSKDFANFFEEIWAARNNGKGPEVSPRPHHGLP
ncbi:hypothetical protein [Tabrizicola fusiformis]|uniref:hypothetical protein n=1 Tax=Tabrizicola sp. SY72 TaxID=2741673 RepID=UPI001574DD24|nr:hypothetical protein [Tabrizicola sp. SY72]NTT85430.1 hypothetical protein [Tabrizicola sp. SY72]